MKKQTHKFILQDTNRKQPTSSYINSDKFSIIPISAQQNETRRAKENEQSRDIIPRTISKKENPLSLYIYNTFNNTKPQPQQPTTPLQELLDSKSLDKLETQLKQKVRSYQKSKDQNDFEKIRTQEHQAECSQFNLQEFESPKQSSNIGTQQPVIQSISEPTFLRKQFTKEVESQQSIILNVKKMMDNLDSGMNKITHKTEQIVQEKDFEKQELFKCIQKQEREIGDLKTNEGKLMKQIEEMQYLIKCQYQYMKTGKDQSKMCDQEVQVELDLLQPKRLVASVNELQIQSDDLLLSLKKLY